eukprot:306706-Chlamydomonas_euryale.AAC.4
MLVSLSLTIASRELVANSKAVANTNVTAVAVAKYVSVTHGCDFDGGGDEARTVGEAALR